MSYSAEQHRQHVSDWATEQRIRDLVRDDLGGAELIAFKPHDSSFTDWIQYVVRWRKPDGECGTHIASLSLHVVPHPDSLFWGHYFPLQGQDPALVGALAKADYDKRH